MRENGDDSQMLGKDSQMWGEDSRLIFLFRGSGLHICHCGLTICHRRLNIRGSGLKIRGWRFCFGFRFEILDF